MKTLWMTVAALGGLMALAPLASAQENKDAKPAEKPGVQAPDRRAPGRERLAYLAEQLKLTDEQKEKVKPILQDEMDKMKELRESTTLSREEKRIKYQQLREDVSKKIKAILTTEQAEKWDKMRGDMRQRPQR
jgi:Spy/CpxP family protein refolding chaperone